MSQRARAGRHSSTESSDSDNSDGSSSTPSGQSAEALPVSAIVMSRYDVEKIPYISDNLDTLNPMVNTNITNVISVSVCVGVTCNSCVVHKHKKRHGPLNKFSVQTKACRPTRKKQLSYT